MCANFQKLLGSERLDIIIFGISVKFVHRQDAPRSALEHAPPPHGVTSNFGPVKALCHVDPHNICLGRGCPVALEWTDCTSPTLRCAIWCSRSAFLCAWLVASSQLVSSWGQGMTFWLYHPTLIFWRYPPRKSGIFYLFSFLCIFFEITACANPDVSNSLLMGF